ncbi:MAG: SDR family NAD(P)-dependent oxidoreductase, partial [Gammaproteobacteria bacterium]|nr:SDR family NAD(P)-dependent oxidoreductase [Gammaproteobacteria bacterium]
MRVSSSLNGQVAIVTGANSGVGRSATEMLLQAGAHVTMVCRSRERGERALAELRGAPNRAAHGGPVSEPVTDDSGGAGVDLELADLSRQEDVRDLADRLAGRLPAIDILVNNAGVTRPQCVHSPEGFELTFATNHLSHFLLTRLLREQLEAGRGRIV